LILENVLLRDHTSIQIAAQIGQCLVASSNRLAVDDPLRGQRSPDLYAKQS
jgi:hypothetical protein